MRSCLLILHLQLFSVLIHEAQGARLMRGSASVRHQSIHVMLSKNDGSEDVILYKSSHCSGGIRKLNTTSISSFTPTVHKRFLGKKEDNNTHPTSNFSPNDKKTGRKEEKMSVNSSPETEPVPEPYPDVKDIAGMDYSQARRKPPIHN